MRHCVWQCLHFSATATWEKKIEELCAGAWNNGWLWTRANGITRWSDGRRVTAGWLARYQPAANFGKEGG
jgi:hypothetical protein